MISSIRKDFREIYQEISKEIGALDWKFQGYFVSLNIQYEYKFDFDEWRYVISHDYYFSIEWYVISFFISIDRSQYGLEILISSETLNSSSIIQCKIDAFINNYHCAVVSNIDWFLCFAEKCLINLEALCRIHLWNDWYIRNRE